jgi:hypothetical protein
MNTSIGNSQARAIDVRIGAGMFYVVLDDGREIGVPYNWFWRLEGATPEELLQWRLIGTGQGIHWEALDEDISIEGLLRGRPEKPAKQQEMERLSAIK